MSLRLFLLCLLILFSQFFSLGCDFRSDLRKDLLKAQQLVQEQNFSKASEIYQGALKKTQSAVLLLKIHFQLGDLNSIYLENYEKALFHYQKIVESAEDPLWQIKAYQKMGEIYLKSLKDYNKAEKIYSLLSKFHPPLEKQVKFEYLRALSILKKGQYELAFQLFKELAGKQGIYQVRALRQLGQIRFYEQNWKEAVFYWEQYTEKEQRKDRLVQVKFLMANAYETDEQLEKAYNLYYSLIGDYPNQEIIQKRLESLYSRRVDRKR